MSIANQKKIAMLFFVLTVLTLQTHCDAMSKPASSKTPAPATRGVVTIDRPLADELDAIGEQVGIPTTAAMVRVALRHVIHRISKGELQVVNGELKPTA